jgi:fructosamine-3-kinase
VSADPNPRVDRIAAALGCASGELALRPAGGGCINQAALATAAGTTYFVKWNDGPLPRQFEAEAAGLAALAASGTPLAVPRPVAYDDGGPGRGFLILEYLPAGRRAAGFDAAFGRGLARLHRATDARGFGFALDGYCGATPQPNRWTARWLDFWREQRLGHQARLARANGLSPRDAARIDVLLDRLDDWIDDDGEPPALIHGDLWSGNLHVAPDGRPALIDPAAYFGHREAELGMMTLMGGFPRATYDAYHEAFPLRDGWRERNGLYELYHLLNHFNLFGGGYGAQAMAIVRRYVG